MKRFAALVAVFALTSCKACPQPTSCTTELPAATPTPSVIADSPVAPQEPSLGIILAPDPTTAALTVTVAATGAPQDLSRWCLFDAQTELDLDMQSGSEERTITFDPPAQGPLRVAYRALGRTDVDPPPIGVVPDRFEAVGSSFLVLPCAFEERALPTSIRFDPEALHPAENKGGASSFGLGDQEAIRTSGRELRQSFFVAGGMGTARFEAVEGHDEAAWFGYTAFDPRPIAADVAALRTTVAQSLGPPSHGRASLLIVAGLASRACSGCMRASIQDSIGKRAGSRRPGGRSACVAIAPPRLRDYARETSSSLRTSRMATPIDLWC